MNRPADIPPDPPTPAAPPVSPAPGQGTTGPRASRAVTGPDRVSGLLAGMRVRKKLIFLHTCFSLVLAGILAAALWPAITRVVEEAELHEARLALRTATARKAALTAAGTADDQAWSIALQTAAAELGPSVTLGLGRAPEPTTTGPTVTLEGLGEIAAQPARSGAGTARLADGRLAAIESAEGGWLVGASAVLADARGAVVRLYIFMTVALLGVYALIALSLEIFVLPRHVYGPIRAMLQADRAAQEGDRSQEIIATGSMPADELGEIMRSRNRTVQALRRHEEDLAVALEQLAFAASDLKKKNHLLETAQRNLADADRLASLGMMSAGLAHELNTPLAVIKGMVEQIAGNPARRLDEQEAALLVRVVGRLERLSESLLDFARVRPARTAPAHLCPLVDEAWTLVRLDREARSVTLENRVTTALLVECDADRLVQVFVNLLRNAADALDPSRRGPGSTTDGPARPHITVDAAALVRDDREWVTITIADNGPGIDPEILGRLFEPFASTKLDSQGTGLGLAVSEGIIREHGGVLLARNREGPLGRGAVFEITLPQRARQAAPAPLSR
ncbi:MAG: sensor histidine kinase [Phycisphaerales bacterium]